MPRLPFILFSALLTALAAMAPAGGIAQGASPMAFALSSPAFAAGGEIPTRYTCEGDDISPPLVWSAPPNGTKSLVLILDDPDAPDLRAPKMTWTHWVLYNLPPTAGTLAQNVAAVALPAGTRTGLNDWKQAAYGGPCPPIGRHRYFHKLFALDIVLSDRGAQNRVQIEAAFAGHVLAQAELIGTYEKK